MSPQIEQLLLPEKMQALYKHLLSLQEDEQSSSSSGMGELRQQVQRLEEELLDASQRLLAADAQRQAERWARPVPLLDYELRCVHFLLPLYSWSVVSTGQRRNKLCRVEHCQASLSYEDVVGVGNKSRGGFFGWQGAIRRSSGSSVGTACPVRQPCSRSPVPVTSPHGLHSDELQPCWRCVTGPGLASLSSAHQAKLTLPTPAARHDYHGRMAHPFGTLTRSSVSGKGMQ